MNLYQSFGNLLEAWVTEGDQSSVTGNNDEDLPTPSPDVGTTLRSESVDSGVETASPAMSLPATPSSISTDTTEIDIFPPERGGLPSPASQCPILSSLLSASSSSPHRRPSRAARVDPTALHLKVEKALQKSDSMNLKNPREPITVDELLVRRPRAFGPKRHASDVVRGESSPSSALKRTFIYTSGPRRKTSETCRRPLPTSYDKRPAQTSSEDLGEQEKTRLSPGLRYLEQVCQMLEEIARQQMHDRASQMETNALQEHGNTEVIKAASTYQSDSKAAVEDLSFCESLDTENEEQSEPQPRREYPKMHLRQRSLSEANISTLHLRPLQADCRHLSTDDLLEKIEEDHEKQGSEKAEMSRIRNFNIKAGSLKIEKSAVRDAKG
ncbi:hypothetical protein EYF80_018429 [Liparis tanakae]|uniref:Uncharacterized protein n=1 Tax=Liparis tanakae TaxID=230148 RepID=A0A4Z2I0L6_9TELE|nr:hypothetical protein EYF80_018429 [Liparis tanakae]